MYNATILELENAVGIINETDNMHFFIGCIRRIQPFDNQFQQSNISILTNFLQVDSSRIFPRYQHEYIGYHQWEICEMIYTKVLAMTQSQQYTSRLDPSKIITRYIENWRETLRELHRRSTEMHAIMQLYGAMVYPNRHTDTFSGENVTRQMAGFIDITIGRHSVRYGDNESHQSISKTNLTTQSKTNLLALQKRAMQLISEFEAIRARVNSNCPCITYLILGDADLSNPILPYWKGKLLMYLQILHEQKTVIDQLLSSGKRGGSRKRYTSAKTSRKNYIKLVKKHKKTNKH